MHLRCPICHRHHVGSHRNCRQDLDQLIRQARRCMARKLPPDHEDWHDLLRAIDASRLGTVGLSRHDVLLHIYDNILCQWYEKADTKGFNGCHRYLSDFVERAEAGVPRRWQNPCYRWLYLLSWLSEGEPGDIPTVFLEPATGTSRQFQRSVRVTGRMSQFFIHNFSQQRLFVAFVSFWIAISDFMGIPVLQLTDMLPFFNSLAGLAVLLATIFLLFFVSIYRHRVVLNAEDLHFGPFHNQRRLGWEDVYRVRTRSFLLKLTLEGASLWMWPANRDRAWLEQAMQQLVRRAQGKADAM